MVRSEGEAVQDAGREATPDATPWHAGQRAMLAGLVVAMACFGISRLGVADLEGIGSAAFLISIALHEVFAPPDQRRFLGTDAVELVLVGGGIFLAGPAGVVALIAFGFGQQPPPWWVWALLATGAAAVLRVVWVLLARLLGPGWRQMSGSTSGRSGILTDDRVEPRVMPHEPSRAERLSLIQDRDGGCCVWCSREFDGRHVRATTEHLIARVKGGPSWIENELAACSRCNHERGHASPVQWLDEVRMRGREPRPDVVEAGLRRLADRIAAEGGARRIRKTLASELRKLGAEVPFRP